MDLLYIEVTVLQRIGRPVDGARGEGIEKGDVREAKGGVERRGQ